MNYYLLCQQMLLANSKEAPVEAEYTILLSFRVHFSVLQFLESSEHMQNTRIEGGWQEILGLVGGMQQCIEDQD
ncbi:hypothetical protein AAMO2058_001561200, partial [Amorphochlora amoebiformis]